MAETIMSRLRRGWNAFFDQEDPRNDTDFISMSAGYGVNPNRSPFRTLNDRSIISSIHTRIAVDAADVTIKHVRLDEKDRYLSDIQSGLNNVLTLEANIDQAGTAFRQDIYNTLCEEGVAAIVPVDTTVNPLNTGGYDIRTMRVGSIVEWFPRHVRVSVYNDHRGLREELVLPKTFVAIVHNPLYRIMNEPNSTLQRLIRKLNLLDSVDEAAGSGKLDLIIQLPYVVKSETQRVQADRRRKDIEDQLKGSQYGIAYTDGTERITQLNRPAENDLLRKVDYLTNFLYAQLGLTPAIFNGTADEAEQLNYQNRTINPLTKAVVEALKRTFLTPTARTQKQSIERFRNPFDLVPIANIAEIADKFTRNEILTSNEIRQIVGFQPSSDPKADELRNSNMPQQEEAPPEESKEVVDQSSKVSPLPEKIKREVLAPVGFSKRPAGGPVQNKEGKLQNGS